MFKAIFFAAVLQGLVCAQMMPPPIGGVCRQGKTGRDLNLSETQQKQITGICKESFKKVFELRDTVNKAEAELQSAFDESPVDQGKSNAAIERLVGARADLFRATSQMDLKIRAVLTDEQWQQLKVRDRRGPGRGPDGGWRRGGAPKSTTTPISQPQK